MEIDILKKFIIIKSYLILFNNIIKRVFLFIITVWFINLKILKVKYFNLIIKS